MYSVQITVGSDVIAAINDQLGKTPSLMATAYNRNTSRLRARWLADLRVEPPPAPQFYPIHWKSERQRRAFFATNGFGGGIPYTRTHDLSRGWHVDFDSAEAGGGISVYNEAPEARFVVGVDRQPMFDGDSGGIPWNDPDLINTQYLEEAESVLVDTWFTIADEFAGVP